MNPGMKWNPGPGRHRLIPEEWKEWELWRSPRSRMEYGASEEAFLNLEN